MSLDRRALAALQADHAHMSARAAQARGRGEWVLAAEAAARIAILDAEIGRILGHRMRGCAGAAGL